MKKAIISFIGENDAGFTIEIAPIEGSDKRKALVTLIPPANAKEGDRPFDESDIHVMMAMDNIMKLK